MIVGYLLHICRYNISNVPLVLHLFVDIVCDTTKRKLYSYIMDNLFSPNVKRIFISNTALKWFVHLTFLCILVCDKDVYCCFFFILPNIDLLCTYCTFPCSWSPCRTYVTLKLRSAKWRFVLSISRVESEKGLSASLLIYTYTLFGFSPRYRLLYQKWQERREREKTHQMKIKLILPRRTLKTNNRSILTVMSKRYRLKILREGADLYTYLLLSC